MVLLFFGMQSALSLVYDREMGLMRLVLTAPLPRWYLLLAKIVAATLLGTAQVYVFLVVADLIGIELPAGSWLRLLPALLLVGLMLGSLGLLLSVTFKRIENFASTMNFVIFPMFFLSSALYPLWKLRESGAEWLYRLAWLNPFTHGVELIRFAAYGRFHEESVIIVAACAILFFVLGAFLYDPQRGVLRRSRVAAPS
jgi:ABC-2 type transport system permease protein